MRVCLEREDGVIWYESNNPNGFVTGKRFSIYRPSVTIMAEGMGGDSLGHWHFVCDPTRPDPTRMNNVKEKPPYVVPSMAAIAAAPWNGFNVVSTFSGCGGSCLGYRMAGFRVLWASEFVPAAQATYRANYPDSILDTRDIRQVTADDVLTAIGMKAGEIDVLDGSPPCQAFSTAGKRHKGWGKAKRYEHGATQCNETLFTEYVRLVRGLQPKVFVAENVSGLVKGTAKGYFLEILADLKACGYRVTAKVLDAQWLGVPQMRQRLIFVGVRNDLDVEPIFPKPLTYRYSVRDAIPWIEQHGTHPSHTFTPEFVDSSKFPSPTIQAGGSVSGSGLVLVVGDSQIPQKKGNSFPRGTKRSLNLPCPTIGVTGQSLGGALRYSIEPDSDISRFAIGKEWDNVKPGEQSDRFFNLVKPDVGKPCPTITKSGGNPSTASVVHPLEKRKFTIAELRRICSFPDDFILTGSYAQQWERLGNAVPPLMMRAIAEHIQQILTVPAPVVAARV
jgi:DNA (cytosine-5)-methyltransferase 1